MPTEQVVVQFTVRDYLRLGGLSKQIEGLESLMQESIRTAHSERMAVIEQVERNRRQAAEDNEATRRQAAEDNAKAVGMVLDQAKRIEAMEAQDRRWAIVAGTASAMIMGAFSLLWLALQVWEKIKAMFFSPVAHH